MADTAIDGLLLGIGICHITDTCTSHTEVNKFRLAYVILFKHVYFRQHFACVSTSCAKEYLTAATYYCQVEVKVYSGYLRDYVPQWMPFFCPFPVVT